MKTPYASPASVDAHPLGERQPLWKAFWLVFVPSCLAGHALSLMGLLFWKTQAPETLLRSVSTASSLSTSSVLWLTMTVPYVLATVLGLWAIGRAAPARRFAGLTWLARLVAAVNTLWVLSIVVEGYLRAFRHFS